MGGISQALYVGGLVTGVSLRTPDEELPLALIQLGKCLKHWGFKVTKKPQNEKPGPEVVIGANQ